MDSLAINFLRKWWIAQMSMYTNQKAALVHGLSAFQCQNALKQTSPFAQTREKPYNSGKESKWKTEYWVHKTFNIALASKRF